MLSSYVGEGLDMALRKLLHCSFDRVFAHNRLFFGNPPVGVRGRTVKIGVAVLFLHSTKGWRTVQLHVAVSF